MTRFLATAFSPSPCCWYGMQVLTLDALGLLVSHTPFMGETAATKVCAGLTFAVSEGLVFGHSPAEALAWLKAERGWKPGRVDRSTVTCSTLNVNQLSEETLSGRGPHEPGGNALVWCLDGVDPVSGDLVPGASLYRLLP